MLAHLTREQMGRALDKVRIGIEADEGGDGGYVCLALKSACEEFFINRAAKFMGDTRYDDAGRVLKDMGVFGTVQLWLRLKREEAGLEYMENRNGGPADLIVEETFDCGMAGYPEYRQRRLDLVDHLVEVYA